MRIGVMFANGGRPADAEHAQALAVTAEDLGFESFEARMSAVEETISHA